MQACSDYSGGSSGSDSEWDEQEEEDQVQGDLLVAAAEGDLAAVERALAAGASPDEVSWGERAPASAAPITALGSLLSRGSASSWPRRKGTSKLSPG